MPEHFQRDPAYGALGHPHENHIAQFREERRRQPQRTVHHHEGNRHRQHRGAGIERVHDLLHDQRHAQVGELGGHQERERQRDAPAELQQVGDETADNPPFAGSGRGRSADRGMNGRGGGVMTHGGYIGTRSGKTKGAALAAPWRNFNPPGSLPPQPLGESEVEV